MFRKNRIAIDTAAGGMLALALLLVFIIDRWTNPSAAANTLAGVRVVSGEGQHSKKLRLAMTPSKPEPDPRNFNRMLLWDDMGKLLREMGSDYAFDEIQPADIARNPTALDSYDVLFLTCHPRTVNLTGALVRFVHRGGTLYASDWRFDDLAEAFPSFVDTRLIGSGTRQIIKAKVVDPGLSDFIGPRITLSFDLPQWKTAAFSGPEVATLIRGSYRKQQHKDDPVGVPAEAPLLVKFRAGNGTVIFTSFHNEERNAAVEKKLLQYLVFSLVVADIDAQVTASIQQAGFAAQKSNLLSTPRQGSTARTYHNPHVCPLRFTLGFRSGATLQLTIKSPDGRSHTWRGTSTVTLEVAAAAIGEWHYTVTAVDVPDHFPFTVTISQKKG